MVKWWRNSNLLRELTWKSLTWDRPRGLPQEMIFQMEPSTTNTTAYLCKSINPKIDRPIFVQACVFDQEEINLYKISHWAAKVCEYLRHLQPVLMVAKSFTFRKEFLSMPKWWCQQEKLTPHWHSQALKKIIELQSVSFLRVISRTRIT